MWAVNGNGERGQILSPDSVRTELVISAQLDMRTFAAHKNYQQKILDRYFDAALDSLKCCGKTCLH